jgi:cysteinyl-tRNA synthetase
MSWKHLGETFDIHGGGIDLVFPHHENEIAQSRCSFGTPVMANYWMHNGFLQVEGEKMSKSLGNFFTIRDLLADWPGEVLRFNMLRTHYRQPIDWTVRSLEESYNTLRSLTDWPEFISGKEESFSSAVLDALGDDLNTPQAVSELHVLHRKGDFAALGPTLRALGFLRQPQSKRQIDKQKVVSLIDRRNAARESKNFKESDRIRDELAAMGVVLKDSKDGTTWEIAR